MLIWHLSRISSIGNRRNNRRCAQCWSIPTNNCQQCSRRFVFGAEQSRRSGASKNINTRSRWIVIVVASATCGRHRESWQWSTCRRLCGQWLVRIRWHELNVHRNFCYWKCIPIEWCPSNQRIEHIACITYWIVSIFEFAILFVCYEVDDSASSFMQIWHTMLRQSEWWIRSTIIHYWLWIWQYKLVEIII